MSAEGTLGAGAEVTKGENARMASFVGAIAIADMVKTTLGPKGMNLSLARGCPNSALACTSLCANPDLPLPLRYPASV